MAVTTGTAMLAAGGLSAAGGIYGAHQSKKQSDEAMDAQRDQNQASEQFLREQYAKGRRDALKYIPQGAEAARAAGEQAYETIRKGGKQRVNTYTKGNQAAQQTLVAGLPQMQNALMGEDVDYSALQPTNLGMGGGGFYDSLKLDPSTIPNALAGATDELGGKGPLAEGYNFTPGQTTNRAIVEQAYQQGDINDYQYSQFMRHFNESLDAGGSVYWGSAGGAKPLVDNIGANSPTPVHQNWRATLSDLFTSIYD